MVGKMGSPITTLMLRNVPRRYTQEQLLGEIEAVIGSTADFNFLHMPWDLRNSCNVGYAFLNCCDAEGAKRCREVLDGYHFCMSAKQKQCNVFDAHIQGLESNLIHLLSTSVGVLATGCQPVKSMPVIIWQGRRVRFPQVVAALQRTDAPPEQRLRGQPCGSAGPLFWSDTALLQELAPGLEAMTTRRPFASTEGTTMPGPPEPAPGKNAAEEEYESARSMGAGPYASAEGTTMPRFVSEPRRGTRPPGARRRPGSCPKQRGTRPLGARRRPGSCPKQRGTRPLGARRRPGSCPKQRGTRPLGARRRPGSCPKLPRRFSCLSPASRGGAAAAAVVPGREASARSTAPPSCK
ncbi:unnamed protein product [Prorocentrum cordatum]|uniref:Mei2-like C-terminal RNA recognition motif domain-containing protein n=1 Tax=Prorocentrum cordatum TaxID=2364126 RepID=A0ABN9RKH2_9DINO|nr:unnamed protein product [Polarella glacialis]